MHFAAQFRVATGLRPHDYLLRRRIERAQEMLVKTDSSLIEIALSVGFQTQSHFTNVFKQLAGQPPRAWRQAHYDESAPPDEPRRIANDAAHVGVPSRGTYPNLRQLAAA